MGKDGEGTAVAADAMNGALIRFDNRRSMLCVYGLFLITTILLTWPVTLHIGRRLPGAPGDPQVYLWNIWWLKHSLFALHQNPLWCPVVAWPFGASIAFHTHTFVYSAVAIVLGFFGLNYAASITLLFLNSFALTGLGSYLWCREFGAGRRAAFVGGFVVAFCVYRLGRGMTHYNLLATEFLPFFWLALKRGFDTGRLRLFLLAAVFLLISFWQESQFLIFAGLFGGVYLIGAAIRQPDRLRDPRVWTGCATIVGVFAIGTLPFWLAMGPLLAAGEYAVREGGPPTVADVATFFVPWPHHWLIGDWTDTVYRHLRYPNIENAYVGFVALALAILGVRAARIAKKPIAWAVAAAAFFLILSFGERLEVLSRQEFHIGAATFSIWLPGALFRHIPILEHFRVFSRFVFPAMFALAVPVALGVDWIESRVHRPLVVAPLFALLVAAEVASLPYLTFPYMPPEYLPFGVFERIRNDPDAGTVFCMPPAIRQPHEQYFQMLHEKPIYGGELSRLPEYLARRFAEMPGLGNCLFERFDRLDEKVALEQLTPEFIDRFVEFYDIKYLILHPTRQPEFEILQRIVEARFRYKNRWWEKAFTLYELERAPTGRPLDIDLSQNWGFLYLGRHFDGNAEIGSWATRREAELVLPICGTTWKALTIEMTPFVFDPAVDQTVELELNGRPLGHTTLAPRLTFYQFAIPPEALDDRPISTLAFRFAWCNSPAEKGISDDKRTLAATVRQLHLLSRPREDLPLIGN